MIQDPKIRKTFGQRFLKNFDVYQYIFLYVATTSILSWLVPFPRLINTLLALPAYVILPWMAGSLFIHVICRHRKFDFEETELRVGASWVIGVLLLFILSSVFTLLKRLDLRILGFSVIGIYGGHLLINELFLHREAKPGSTSLSLPIVFLLLLAGIFPITVIYSFQPFPLTFGQSYSYVFEAIEAINTGRLNIWRGHPPFSSLLIGIVSAVYNIHPFYLWSGSNYLLHMLYPFLLYLVTYAVTKCRFTSCFAAIIGVWLYGSPFLLGISNTSLLFVLFPLGLYFAAHVYEKDLRWSELVFTAVALVTIQLLLLLGVAIPTVIRLFIVVGVPLMVILIVCVHLSSLFYFTILPFLTLVGIAHPYEGIMITLFLFLYLGIRKIRDMYYIKFGSAKINMLAIIGLILLIFNALQIWGLIRFGDNFTLSRWLYGSKYDGSAYDIDAIIKYKRLTEPWGALPIYLFLASILLVFLIKRFHISEGINSDVDLLPLAFTSIICFTTFLLPDGHLVRAGKYLNVFFSIFISSFILRIAATDKNAKVIFKVKDKIINIRFKILYFIFILFLILPTFQTGRINTIQELTKANPEGYYSFIQTYEVNVFEWILQNTPENDTILISDPYTMYMLHKLTGRDNGLLEKDLFIYDFAYSEESLQDMKHLRERLFLAGHPEIAYREARARGKGYSTVLIILSKRTATWILSGRNFPQLPTADISESMMKCFLDEEYFNLRFNVGNKIFIFEPVESAPLGRLNSTLILRLSFDEGLGSIVNSSGTARTYGIIFTKRPTPNRVEGISGNALELNSLYEEYVRMPDTGDLDGMKAITITLWFYSYNDEFLWPKCLVSKPPPDWQQYMQQPYFVEIYGDGSIRFVIRNGTHNIIDLKTPSGAFLNEKWTFLAATWDGEIATIYVNGVPVAKGRGFGSMYSAKTDLLLGRNTLPQQPQARFFNGIIDEFHLYNRSLSSFEISEMFSSSRK